MQGEDVARSTLQAHVGGDPLPPFCLRQPDGNLEDARSCIDSAKEGSVLSLEAAPRLPLALTLPHLPRTPSLPSEA